MDRSEEYRRMAASCLRLAGRVKDTAEKMTLIEMARVWHDQISKLETERQAHIVYELSEQPQFVAQQ